MDGQGFDTLARFLVSSTSRRRAVKGLLGAALGVALMRFDGSTTAQDDCFGQGPCPSGTQCVQIAPGQGCCEGSGGNMCAFQPPIGCPSDQTNCNGQCTDTSADDQNCGTCGNQCADVCCNGTCVLIDSDPNNCGDCGIVCGSGQTCQNLACVAVPQNPAEAPATAPPQTAPETGPQTTAPAATTCTGNSVWCGGQCVAICGGDKILDSSTCQCTGQVLGATASPLDPAKPGGLWISPQQGFVVTNDTLHFAAHAYPTNPGDPPIAYVNFTAWYPGVDPSKWVIAHKATTPVEGTTDEYVYDWNTSKLPVAPIRVSFDVYDTANGKNLAPNGTRDGTIQPDTLACGKCHYCTWGDEAPDTPIPLQSPFAPGTAVVPGGVGNFYGDNDHDNPDNDYYATDWSAKSDGTSTDGMAVYPVAAGTVHFVGWENARNDRSGLGYKVVIEHSNGVETSYGHLQEGSSPVTVGNSVTTATRIGVVGSTGNANGPHLHLRFRVQGNSHKGQSPRPSPMDGQKLCDGRPIFALPKTGGAVGADSAQGESAAILPVNMSDAPAAEEAK